jgi:BirA family transcriptional regulator, biotin operon repressor / biotin---[acetyl-CoA-carboxylase] ligase
MADVPMHWGAEALWQQLLPLLPGLSVEVVERTSSTNSALLERARVLSRPDPDDADVLVQRSVESSAFGRRAADVQPCLLVAENQTGGRGRHGRVWQSARGASLTFSLSLPLARTDWSGLSLAVGVALAEALDPHAPGAAPRIGLKWPNDLWLMDDFSPAQRSGRKLGGVLIETVAAGQRRLAVIGIGLNVMPLGSAADASTTSSGFACLQEIEPGIDAPATLARIALPLARALREFDAEGFAPFVARFAARDLLAGQSVRTTRSDAAEGIAVGVTEHGALEVDTGSGLLEVTSGEVSVRLDRPDAD